MSKTGTFVAECSLQSAPVEAAGGYVDIGGERYYRIENYDTMAPFFISLVSDSDHWLFLSSGGGLTAGRKDPDHALFPYYTDDRIHDSQDQTGSKTILRVKSDGRVHLWEPFSQRYEGLYRVSRNLCKNAYGNKVVFEEVNHDLGLTFSYSWMSSERFGFVRRSVLTNNSKSALMIEVLDGIQNVLPSGVTRRFQMEYSTLVDGYKRTELEQKAGLALFRLSSIPVDKAEPSEALRVNVAWSVGLDSARILLSSSQFSSFRAGLPLSEETDIRGRRGAYMVNSTLTLPPSSSKEWFVVADLDQDTVRVRNLLRTLTDRSGLIAQINEDIDRGSQNLLRIVAGADGLQRTDDELSSWRHFSNVLFNAMRGGVPDDGYRISRDDLKAFIAAANRDVAARRSEFIDSLSDGLPHWVLLSRVAEQNDADLERLVNEYLPLTFSRRHGDPSRPWNIFAIEIKDEHGKKILNYQGNWRDIFQNWEALALSYPGFVESMIFKFVDSSTADGYNPYRVMRDGYEWEIIDPHDSWSFIGYWGDHQVIYLLKLLEQSRRHHPAGLARLLTRRVFTYANVPYRIKPYTAMLKNPRSTIDFDLEAHKRTEKRVAALGVDGKALLAWEGHLAHANLTEKMLVVVLSKLSNYIPEAGIWLNTQRPEWNDANNALVGYGVSMVTLYYLRRFLSFFRDLLAESGSTSIEVAEEIAGMLASVAETLGDTTSLLNAPISDADRKEVLDALGHAGEAYRSQVYGSGFSGVRKSVSVDDLRSFCETALRHIDHSIRANRRDDGLYHSYNLMKVTERGIEIRRLYEMLEGQVAILSSGALSHTEAADLLDALRKSSMYREDQQSYILYPNRALPHFLEKNNIPAGAAPKSKLLSELLRRDDPRIIVRDADGGLHFHPSFRNADLLKKALEGLKEEGLAELVNAEQRQILDLYEQVFDHQSFTGRSGTFYKYEGLGSIYWHMVSKLLLAVSELLESAAFKRVAAATVERLRTHYEEIREGIGAHKSPAAYGAVPTDPYSHTPSFAGVQQPGMTGQVKEDIISRFAEMGVHIEAGRVAFVPELVRSGEFLKNPSAFRFYDVEGKEQTIGLEAGTLAFTLCQTPVVVHKASPPHIDLAFSDGRNTRVPGLALDAEASAAVFERTGTVRRIDVYCGLDS